MDTRDRSIALTASLILGVAMAAPAGAGSPRACSASSKAGFSACKHDAKDDRFEGQAICLNESDQDARGDCLADLNGEFGEARGECREVLEARLDLCDQLGEAPYDPDFDPAGFDSDLGALTRPNPYLPIAVGNEWEYEGGDE